MDTTLHAYTHYSWNEDTLKAAGWVIASYLVGPVEEAWSSTFQKELFIVWNTTLRKPSWVLHSTAEESGRLRVSARKEIKGKIV